MKKKFTLVWMCFLLGLVWALFSALSTTPSQNIPTRAAPKPCGSCHTAGTLNGNEIAVSTSTSLVNTGEELEISIYIQRNPFLVSENYHFGTYQLAILDENNKTPGTYLGGSPTERNGLTFFEGNVFFNEGQTSQTIKVKWKADCIEPNQSLLVSASVGLNFPTGNEFQIWSSESNTVINTSSSAISCIPKPDISLENPIVFPKIPAGSTTWFEVDVKNNKPATSDKPYLLACFLSTDNILGSNDVLIGEFGQPDLPENGRKRIEGAFTVGHSQPAGNYFLILQADKNNQIVEDNETNNTLAVPITITAGNGFCASKSLYNTNEYIKSVKIGSIEANTIADNYSEKLYLDRHFKKGTAQPVTITGGFSGPFTASEYCRIWADINQDNQFTDNEIVFSKKLTKPAIAGSSTKSISGSLTIPLAAKSGYTRLRVSMQRGAWPPACGNLTLGEVEDYVVNVVDELKPGDRQSEDIFIEKSPEIALAPNPAADGTTLDLSVFFGKNVDVAVFDLNGKLAFQQNIEASANPYLSIQTGDWQPGVYTVFVRAEGFRPVAKKLAVVRM